VNDNSQSVQLSMWTDDSEFGGYELRSVKLMRASIQHAGFLTDRNSLVRVEWRRLAIPPPTPITQWHGVLILIEDEHAQVTPKVTYSQPDPPFVVERIEFGRGKEFARAKYTAQMLRNRLALHNLNPAGFDLPEWISEVI